VYRHDIQCGSNNAQEAAVEAIYHNEFSFITLQAQSPGAMEACCKAVSIAKPILGHIVWRCSVQGSHIPTCGDFSDTIVHPVCEENTAISGDGHTCHI